ncbi:hypothetical protein QW180_30235 [Vibrio sinaloensis]|nr:hypothetical protein [Vibrio sinaloensis]
MPIFLKSEQASGTYTPALTTIVVAGNLNLRNSITAVEKNLFQIGNQV